MSKHLSIIACALAWSLTAPAFAQQIIAHRGASATAPENTIAAFKLAWDEGADGIEGDFHLTKDGYIVAIHDRTTKKSTGSRNLTVAQSTLDELRGLDVGWWRGKQYKGAMIPTLREVLAAVPKGKTFYLEIKVGKAFLPKLAEVMRRANFPAEQLRLIAFDASVIEHAKKLWPPVQASWLVSFRQDKATEKWSPTAAEVIETAKRINADGIGVNANKAVVDAAFVAEARKAGLHLNVWTVNDAKDAAHFRALGVDSITTDKPGELREKLATEAIGQHLQVYLPFDENTEDRTPAKRHGSVVTKAKRFGKADTSAKLDYSDGVFGKAMDLKAGKHAVQLPLALPDRGTLMFWHRASDWYNYQTLADNPVDDNQWELWIDNGAELSFRVKGDAKVEAKLHKTADLSAWKHIAVMWDRHDKSPRALRLFVDGVLVASKAWPKDILKEWPAPGASLYLGGGNTGNDKGKGMIDDAAVFDIPLDPLTLRKLMNQGVGDLFNWRGKLKE